MHLPNLPPDIEFARLPQSDEAIRYSFDVKCAAMKPHILKRWTWDENWQIKTHQEHFNEKPFFKISFASHDVGTISLINMGTYIRFGEFYLLPNYQKRGIGTRILVHCLRLADNMELPVRLEYLKWNPVGSLYRRHGFLDIGDTEIHCLLERMPEAQLA